MPKGKVLLIGGGGHARSVLSAMQRAGLEAEGIVESDAALLGSHVMGVPVIGTDSDLPSFAAKNHVAIVTLGNTGQWEQRAALCGRCRQEGLDMYTFVAASAVLGSGVKLASGTVVLEGATLNALAVIGEDCIINTGAIVEHDVTIGNRVHVASGARVCGGVDIGDDAFVGAGATLIHGIKIGARSIVAAGSVVTKDVHEGAKVMGNPAMRVSM